MIELESILGDTKKTIKLSGKEIDIFPMKLKNISLVMKKKEVVMAIFKGDIVGAITDHFDEVVDLLCSISGQEKEFVENLELPEVIDFVEAVIDLNKSGFFLVQEKLKNLTSKTNLQNMNGQKQSSSSSKKATPSKESRATQ